MEAPVETVTLPRPLINALLHAAQASPGVEVCGLIGARDGMPTSLYPITNVAERPDIRFLLDAQEQLDAMRTMRERGEEMYAIYHSHPRSSAQPSATDLDMSAYPDQLYLIISLNTKGVLEMRGFRLHRDRVDEVTLQL